MQLKTKPQLDALNKQAQFSEKNIIRNKKNDGGFTLVELIILLVIIIILAAIALPSFLDCSLKARRLEGRQYVGSMNRAQQANFAEKGVFSNSLNDLGLGIKTQTINYNYSISITKNAAFSYAVSISKTHNLPSYVGAVFILPVSPANNDKTTVGILCQANSPGKTQLPNPILDNDGFVCPAGSTEVSK
ncbi:type IV pilin-like G/H family protein [Microcoleus sp. bin38.metabat.b11b12b14.051]|uniref:type IV pilin-like G/H family protein n=1 Tax=Microcoleus sp. bin38.metabat.b11b12b14.051 TaxID=2742709 RepID=UPI0025CF1335|nr:type IV pilin-like G/H family protein [Microcoleus sp. bin38.metabat.b11b12b14.051]